MHVKTPATEDDLDKIAETLFIKNRYGNAAAENHAGVVMQTVYVWIEKHGSDPRIRERIEKMRAKCNDAFVDRAGNIADELLELIMERARTDPKFNVVGAFKLVKDAELAERIYGRLDWQGASASQQDHALASLNSFVKHNDRTS